MRLSLFRQSRTPREHDRCAADDGDRLLARFLHARTEEEAEWALEPLAQAAEAIAIRQAGRFWQVSIHPRTIRDFETEREYEAAEAVRNTMEQVIRAIRRQRACPTDISIQSFRAYVYTVAQNACAAAVRARYPLRHRLKNRIRELAKQHPDFAIWPADGEGPLVFGRSAWKGRTPEPRQTDGAAALLLDASAEASRLFPDGNPEKMELEVVSDRLLRVLAGPVFFDDFVGLCAGVMGLEEPARAISDRSSDEDLLARVPDTSPDTWSEVRVQQDLGMIWKEIQALPLRQRIALLLNLGDGDVDVFRLHNVASLVTIADALEMTPEGLAALWPDLPLEDLRIAQMIACTRQQVINLRQSARARLSRRLAAAL